MLDIPFLMFMTTEDTKRDLVEALRANPGADAHELAYGLGIDTSLWSNWDWDKVIEEARR